ncbi:Rhodanese-like domain-containing protein 14, chloroplastic [Linum perenne]
MAAAVLPSIGSPSTSSSSSSTSIYHSKTAALLHCPSSFFTVRPYGRLKGSIFNSPHTLPRSFKILCAATKPAKSPAEEEWKIKRELLLQKKVRSVEVKEALRLQKENNFVILDVRPEAEFKEAHVPGAINVQIYRLIKEWTAWDIARRAAFAFFGIFAGTEENPEFIQSMLCSLIICFLQLPCFIY